MFGYIRPMSAELKVRELELYKSFYCGLCRTMGKKISPFSRIALSYDIVFLALLRIALTGEQIAQSPFRCLLKPTKKRQFIKENEALLYSACVSANLSYYKYIDDLADEKNRLKKILKNVFFPPRLILSQMKKKANGYFSKLEEQIAPYLLRLSELEKSGGSIDESAACFSGLMKNVLSFGLLDSGRILIAENIGLRLGRWLYLIDMLDDFEKDKKRGEYNPFVLHYGDKQALSDDIGLVRFSLDSELCEMSSAFSLLDPGQNPCIHSIVFNIIDLGLFEAQEKILNKFKNGSEIFNGQSI